MNKICFCIQVLFLSVYAQNELSVEFEKIEIVSFNPDVVENPIVSVFQYNDTSQGINASGTLKKDFGMDIKVNMDASKLQENNEYKVMTSVVDVDMCDLINKNQFGLKDLLKYGNFTVCPWKQAHYVANNAMLDASKLPANVPPGLISKK
ncbi:hypothetical protein RN001_001109 [Aquatica leii]|uniref:Uncharacterized protein n=1 Tax=Aquatica leii TaxID=1421715 RepID=A0AAN7QMF3_9COLE|nr:hypothetical protein RN001_001109 [Aquatica leii]